MHWQGKVATDPDAILSALKPYLPRLRRVGHEAGALSPWLHPELLALWLQAVCLETRNVRAAMSAQRHKTDAADALGIAHIVRTGWFRRARDVAARFGLTSRCMQCGSTAPFFRHLVNVAQGCFSQFSACRRKVKSSIRSIALSAPSV